MNKWISFPRTRQILFIYLVIISTIALGLNFFIRSYVKANYSESKREELLSGTPRLKHYGDDPCSNLIYGSPDVKHEYVKINIYCDSSHYSTNTLAIKAISPQTYSAAIKLVGRINLFEAVIKADRIERLGNWTSGEVTWRCFIDNDEIKDFEAEIKPKQNVNCFYR